jgi:hypothetical protein
VNKIQKTVIGGVVALLLFALYANWDSPNGPKRTVAQRTFSVGQDIDVSITLVTTDAKALACWSAQELGGRHCEFESPSQKWQKPPTSGRQPAQDVLAPYKTTDDILFLVPGLWLDPALAKRLTIDPPDFSKEHIRFVANCKMHLDGEMENFGVRWAQQGQWQAQNKAFVGTVSGCVLSEGG